MGASSSSHRERKAEPPIDVHSQPSTPSSRGTMAELARRRRTREAALDGERLRAAGLGNRDGDRAERHHERLAEDPAAVELHAGRAELEVVDRAFALPRALGLELD